MANRRFSANRRFETLSADMKKIRNHLQYPFLTLVPGSMLSLEDMILWQFFYYKYDRKRPKLHQIEVLCRFTDKRPSTIHPTGASDLSLFIS